MAHCFGSFGPHSGTDKASHRCSEQGERLSEALENFFSPSYPPSSFRAKRSPERFYLTEKQEGSKIRVSEGSEESQIVILMDLSFNFSFHWDAMFLWGIFIHKCGRSGRSLRIIKLIHVIIYLFTFWRSWANIAVIDLDEYYWLLSSQVQNYSAEIAGGEYFLSQGPGPV